ncbi:MAG: ArsR/SmtB family transcription factor [Parvibaculales bacterium]
MERLLTALRGAGEQTRLRLLAVLAQGELTVKELTLVLGQSQPRISRHLKLMTDAGLITRFPEGSWVFYRVAEAGEAAHLARDLVKLLPKDDAVLLRDNERLEGVRAQRAQAAQSYFTANAANWGRLRALHVADETIERVMLDLAGDRTYANLVDLGTGTGRMLELFGQKAEKGVGFDANADMLSLARTNLDRVDMQHFQVRLGDITNLPLNNGEADLVLMHQVLHFLEDPAAVVFEAARILSPGGTIIIADFAPHNHEHLREEHAHRRLGFTEQEIVNLLRDAGIEVKRPLLLENDHQHADAGLSVYLWSGQKQSAAEIEAYSLEVTG